MSPPRRGAEEDQPVRVKRPFDDLLLAIIFCGIRYIVFWLYNRFFRKRRPYIDNFNPVDPKHIYGVPLGGLGAGSIGRTIYGAFTRFQVGWFWFCLGCVSLIAESDFV